MNNKAILLLSLFPFWVSACAGGDSSAGRKDNDEDLTEGDASGGDSAEGDASGGDSSGGDASGGDSSGSGRCEDLSEEACLEAEDRCLVVVARRLNHLDDDVVCVSDESTSVCRTIESGCSDSDIESFWCVGGEYRWVTPQECGPEGAKICDSLEKMPACE